MGIYSHYTVEQLTALRDQLIATLHARLNGPSASSWGDRRVQYEQQSAEIRKEIGAVNTELNRRTGTPGHRPIYLVG